MNSVIAARRDDRGIGERAVVNVEADGGAVAAVEFEKTTVDPLIVVLAIVPQCQPIIPHP